MAEKYALAHSENHTTCSKSQRYKMAGVSRADIIAEDIASSDGTFWGTMEYWSLREGPVMFPKFQSAYWALRREHNMVDECPPHEDKSALGR